jgi:phosphatidylcholine synthase
VGLVKDQSDPVLLRLREETRSRRAAWGIHVFTGTGILAGLMGLLSVLNDTPKAALIWLMVALVIDGVDGPFARRVNCRLHVPNIDGNTLDLVIDYVTCVVAPALFLDRFDMLPRGFSLIGAGLVMLTALYCFSRTDMMTPDKYFRGFPAMWNLVVTVMWALHSRPWVNFGVVVVFAALSLTNVKVPHPVQVREYRNLTIPVMVIWLGTMLGLIIAAPGDPLVAPHPPMWTRVIEFAGIFYFVWRSAQRTFRPEPQPEPGEAPDATF